MATNDPPPIASPPRWRAALWLLLVVHAGLAWWLFGSGPIGASWREADTQAIARSLATEDFDVLRPRVDWRGKGEGFVECEFPLYQALVALGLRSVGDAEWPGRLLSTLATIASALAFFVLLERRCGGRAAWLGTLVWLGSAQVVFLGTRVMPDMVSTALALVGLAAFDAWMHSGRRLAFAMFAVATLLGVMAKPTAAQVVLLQMAWAALLAPARLRRPAPWVVWGVVAVAVAAWTLHARGLGLATGLTFGVTFGDTKLPGFEHLLRPSVWRSLMGATLEYGASWFGVLAVLVLVVRRRLDRADLALLVVVAAGLVGSLRYSHDVRLGPQYHIWSAIAGAWLVARAWPTNVARGAWWAAVLVVMAHAGWQFAHEHEVRAANANAPHLVTAATLQRLSAPGDLVVVHGPKPAFDDFWRRPNNYEEPVLLYLSRRKGWVLPVDRADANELRRLVGEGAGWYVDPVSGAKSPDVKQWLDEHGEMVHSDERATIHRLRR